MDKNLHLWNIDKEGEHVEIKDASLDDYRDWALSTDGNFLYATEDRRETSFLALWDIKERKELFRLENSPGQRHPSFSADSRFFTFIRDNNIVLWDLKTKTEKHQIPGKSYKFRYIGFNPQGTLIQTTGDDNFNRFWGTETGLEVAKYPIPPGGIRGGGFTPNGAYFFLQIGEGKIVTWELEKVIQKITPPDNLVAYQKILDIQGRKIASKVPTASTNLYSLSSPIQIQESPQNIFLQIQSKRQPSRDLETTRALFEEFFQAGNWNSARLMCQQLQSQGEGENEIMIFTEFLLNHAEEIALNGRLSMALWYANIALSLDSDVSPLSIPEATKVFNGDKASSSRFVIGADHTLRALVLEAKDQIQDAINEMTIALNQIASRTDVNSPYQSSFLLYRGQLHLKNGDSEAATTDRKAALSLEQDPTE